MLNVFVKKINVKLEAFVDARVECSSLGCESNMQFLYDYQRGSSDAGREDECIQIELICFCESSCSYRTIGHFKKSLHRRFEKCEET